jgi:hypothetical protein
MKKIYSQITVKGSVTNFKLVQQMNLGKLWDSVNNAAERYRLLSLM